MDIRLADLKVRHIVALLLVAGLITGGVFWTMHAIRVYHKNQRVDKCILTYAFQLDAQKACEQGILSPVQNP